MLPIRFGTPPTKSSCHYVIPRLESGPLLEVPDQEYFGDQYSDSGIAGCQTSLWCGGCDFLDQHSADAEPALAGRTDTT